MPLEFDRYSFDEVNRALWRGTERVKVDPQQLDLLEFFLQHAGELLSRQQIIDAVWEGRATADSVLSVSIAKLRKALGKPDNQRDYIESRYGRGYRFLSSVRRSTPLLQGRASLDPGQELSRAPLVGRAEVLSQLTAAIERATRGQGGLCIVAGEAGIGKTRLAETVAKYAQEDDALQVLWGRCQQEASTPLWPVRQIMRQLAGPGSSHAYEPGEQADSITSFEDASRKFFGTLSCNTSIDHPTLDALTHNVLSASAQRPLLLLIDDLQWADGASLRLFTYLADEIPRRPILLLGTLRSGKAVGEGQRELSRLWTHRNCHRIELSRLSAQDVGAYARALFGEGSAELARVLFARSEGNPFFMVDLLRTVDGAGAARGTQPGANLSLKLSGLALEAVRERLQDLPALSRRVLCAAAVIGHDFDIGLLGHVTELSPQAVLDALTDSIANGTVVASDDAVGVFAFDHELIREALSAELVASERAQLHLRAAEGLLQRRSTGGDVTHAELAHHFLSAQPHGAIDVAIAHAQAAAAESSRLGSHADVRDILRRAIDVLRFHVAPRPEMRAALLLQLAMVERILGDPTYGTHLQMGVTLAREHRLGALLSLAGQQLSPSPGLVGHADAAQVLEAAEASLAPQDYENRAIVRAHLAWTPPNCHSARRVQQLISEAKALSDTANSPAARAAVNDARLFFSAGPDTFEQAELVAQEIEGNCARHPETARQARRMLVALFRLVTAMQRGDRVGVARAIRAREELLAQLNNAELNWHHARMLLIKRMNEGELAAVKDELIALRARAKRLELHASQLLWSLDYGVLLWRTSDVSELGPRVRPTLRLSAQDSPLTRAGKIRSMADFGLLDDLAQAMGHVSVEALEDLPRDREYLAVLCKLAVGAAAVHSRVHAEVLLRLLAPYAAYYAVGVSYHCDGAVASHLGLLCEALGETQRACEYFAQGLDMEEAFGLAPCAAVSALRLGKLLAQQGDAGARERAQQCLVRARSEAKRLGMAPLQRDADDALSELGRDARARRAASDC